jgi:hypothetical protein
LAPSKFPPPAQQRKALRASDSRRHRLRSRCFVYTKHYLAALGTIPIDPVATGASSNERGRLGRLTSGMPTWVITCYGVRAASYMTAMYALGHRIQWFILAFAPGGCWPGFMHPPGEARKGAGGPKAPGPSRQR